MNKNAYLMLLRKESDYMYLCVTLILKEEEESKLKDTKFYESLEMGEIGYSLLV